MKNALVLLGLLGIFASGFGADSIPGLKPLSPLSAKLLMKDSKVGASDVGMQATMENSGKNGPLNVILLLIDGLYQSDVATKLENHESFPVHGLLQSCSAENIHDSGENICNCDEKLGSSIASLLSWAQRVKGMSTSALYEMTTSISGPRARLIDRQRREAPWLLQIEPMIESEEANVASKLKDTFFRSLVNGLSVTQSRQPSVVQRANVAELASSVLKELNSMPNEHGHLAIIRTGADGLDSVLEAFKRNISSANTLTVVMNSCPQDHLKAVPFFAGGHGSERLSRVVDSKWLHDLPAAIRSTIVGNDQATDDAENIKRTKIFLYDTTGTPVPKSIYNENYERFKRQDDPPAAPAPGAEKAVAKSDDGNGKEAIAHSTMMIVTAVTATITYALKF